MQDLVKEVSYLLRDKGLMLATAESCTGGLISAAMTELSGSSAVFDRSFITYSNEAKIDMLGVSAQTLDKFGAVSAETAQEMAIGTLKKSRANIVIAVTGIAGPTGGTAEKPVGLVYTAIGLGHKDSKNEINVFKCNFEGNRTEIRNHTVYKALSEVKNILERALCD